MEGAGALLAPLLFGGGMSEEQVVEMDALQACAERLSSAAEALQSVLGKLEAQYESLNRKVDRIVAAVEEQPGGAGAVEGNDSTLSLPEKDRAAQGASREGARLGSQQSHPLTARGECGTQGRRTVPTLVLTLLAKGGVEDVRLAGSAALEKALQVLSVEQRIAVKAELARAGMLE